MPFIFQQPSPISPATSIGAGQADVNTKEFSTLAGLIESYGRLAASAHGGGGGGGGGRGDGSSGGYVQVLPTSDYGATTQVESQANREQRAMDLGFAEENQNQRLAYQLKPENDQVARHIKMQEDYATQRQMQNQQADQQAKQRAIQGLVGPGGSQVEQGPTPKPVPTWGMQDDQDLTKAIETGRAINKDWESGKLRDGEARASLLEPLMAKIQGLQARKQEATQYGEQQQQQKIMQAQELLVGQQDRLSLETRKVFAQHGKDGIVDQFDPKTGEYIGSLQWHPKTQTMEPIKHQTTGKATATEKEPKEMTDSQLFHEAESFAKGTVPFNADKDKHNSAIADVAQKQFTQLKQMQTAKVEARAQEKRMKEADPKIVQAYTTFTSAIPKNDQGQVDLNRASVPQLQVLEKALMNHKGLGMSPEDAARKANVVRQALENKLNPKPVATMDTPAPKAAMQSLSGPPSIERTRALGGSMMGGPGGGGAIAELFGAGKRPNKDEENSSIFGKWGY